MRRSVTTALVVLGVFAGACPAAAGTRYAPVDQPGPALTVDPAALEASLTCTGDVFQARRTPVLLTPATTVNSRENYGWNWIPALRARGIPVCTSDQPGDDATNMGDMQRRAEFVVYAIRRVFELSGRRISVVGHSQGGMIMRWPLRFWPDTRRMVGEVVGMAATNHGSVVVRPMCSPQCSPALWQQRDDSQWTAALNSAQETFAGIDYTEIYSRTDEFVQPNLDDSGTSSLHGPGRITNVALQDLCPADTNEHLLIGTIDPVAWALGLDALTHDGPADPKRVPSSVCAEPTMPGFDRMTGPAALAEAVVRVETQLSFAPKTAAEPPLRCYVTASCPAPAAAVARPLAAGQCASRRVFPIRVRGRSLRSARVTVDGRAVPVRRRGGRLVATVDLRGRVTRNAVVRIRAVTGAGRTLREVRRYRLCAPR